MNCSLVLFLLAPSPVRPSPVEPSLGALEFITFWLAPFDRNLEKKPRKDAIISSNANRSIIPFTSNVLLYWELTEIRVGLENIAKFFF